MITRTILLLQFVFFPLSGFNNRSNRKKQFLLVVLFFLTLANGVAQNWKPTGALSASGPDWYLTGATSVGNDVFAVNVLQTMVYSSDLGVTWSAPAASKLQGTYAYVVGIENRLYASTKINTYDYELNYSTDKGATWKPDTIGLPQSPAKTGKSAMILKYMENNYMLAHNNLKAFYKKVEETNWKPTSIDFAIVDVAATKDKWLAIGAAKILQSTNNGESWTMITTTGLPANFQGNKICTNGSRIYISNAPANGGQDIYYSDNGGLNWTLTNSAGKYSHANPWIQYMYAVDDYLFAAILPKDSKDAPPFIVSTTPQPNFLVGDVSGFIIGKTTSSLPFFFHVKNKLFTMMWDLFSSEPGFNNSTTTAQINLTDYESISVYPNPATNSIQLKTNNTEIEEVEIYNMRGEKIFRQTGPELPPIAISGWIKGMYLVNTTTRSGKTNQTKFIKN